MQEMVNLEIVHTQGTNPRASTAVLTFPEVQTLLYRELEIEGEPSLQLKYSFLIHQQPFPFLPV